MAEGVSFGLEEFLALVGCVAPPTADALISSVSRERPDVEIDQDDPDREDCTPSEE